MPRIQPKALSRDRLMLEAEGNVLGYERRHSARRLMGSTRSRGTFALPETAGLGERLPGALVHRRRAALVGDRAVLLQAEGGFLKVD
jgi:hypothetical protein